MIYPNAAYGRRRLDGNNPHTHITGKGSFTDLAGGNLGLGMRRAIHTYSEKSKRDIPLFLPYLELLILIRTYYILVFTLPYLCSNIWLSNTLIECSVLAYLALFCLCHVLLLPSSVRSDLDEFPSSSSISTSRAPRTHTNHIFFSGPTMLAQVNEVGHSHCRPTKCKLHLQLQAPDHNQRHKTQPYQKQNHFSAAGQIGIKTAPTQPPKHIITDTSRSISTPVYFPQQRLPNHSRFRNSRAREGTCFLHNAATRRSPPERDAPMEKMEERYRKKIAIESSPHAS